MRKNQKGITLIALVITIIVLLILAGVTISRVVKKDGVINKASQSAQSTAIARAREEIERAVNDAMADSMIDSDGVFLAERIDEQLDLLARRGSDIDGITYEYRRNNQEDSGDAIQRRAGNVIFEKQEDMELAVLAAKKEPAEELTKAKATTIGKPVINTFIVYYKGTDVLHGVLNMGNGDFDFEDPNKPVQLDPIKEEEAAKEEDVEEYCK